jgi:hypothetical protein
VRPSVGWRGRSASRPPLPRSPRGWQGRHAPQAEAAREEAVTTTVERGPAPHTHTRHTPLLLHLSPFLFAISGPGFLTRRPSPSGLEVLTRCSFRRRVDWCVALADRSTSSWRTKTKNGRHPASGKNATSCRVEQHTTSSEHVSDSKKKHTRQRKPIRNPIPQYHQTSLYKKEALLWAGGRARATPRRHLSRHL